MERWRAGSADVAEAPGRLHADEPSAEAEVEPASAQDLGEHGFDKYLWTQELIAQADPA